MVAINIDKLIADFRELGNRYLETRDLRIALDLDDQSARLMSASGYLLQRPRLSSQLHDFRKAVHHGDHELAIALFRQIEEQLDPPNDAPAA